MNWRQRYAFQHPCQRSYQTAQDPAFYKDVQRRGLTLRSALTVNK